MMMGTGTHGISYCSMVPGRAGGIALTGSTAERKYQRSSVANGSFLVHDVFRARVFSEANADTACLGKQQ